MSVVEGEEDGDLIYVGDDQTGDQGDEYQEQEKEYLDNEAGVDENETVEVEQEHDLNEDTYEIRDEEDNTEENVDEKDPADTSGEKADGKSTGKDDNMLVVDEWDDDVDSISDEEDQTKTEDGKELIDPEESEKALLHMPSLKTIMGDLLHLRRNRRVSIFPLSMADLALPELQNYLESEICEEVKMQFVRPSDDMKTWTGFLSVTFVTSKNATQAVEALKSLREGITVKVDANSDTSLENFLKAERKTQAWPAFWADRLLLVRSIPIDTKADDLRAIFTDAEEIVIAKESASAQPKRRDTTGSSVLGYAYVLYESPAAAKKAAERFESERVEFNNKPLDAHLYREPVTEVPRTLLYLRRRRLVLRHLEKLLRNVEKSKKDPEYKLAPWTESRIAACKAVIEKDDKVRKELNLPTPTYEDFKRLKGFKQLTPQEAERALVSLGIVAKTKKVADGNQQQNRRDKDKQNMKRDKGRGGHGGRGHPRRGGSPRNARRSPPGGRRRNEWGSGDSRRSGFMGHNRSGGSRGMNQPGGGLGMVNPLALMMQQNIGLLGASGLVNPAVLNPVSMMLQQGGLLGSSGGSGSGMHGQGPVSLLSTMGGGSGNLEPPPKMLRLDETGNLRAERDFRQDRIDGRGFDRGMRDDRGAQFRDRGRQRSRSPDYRMPAMRSQRGGGHLGNARSGFGDGGGSHRGFDSSGGVGHMAGTSRGGEDDISLLMNLSKMLSQKMEQKRQQAEHGGYDRM